MRHWNWAEIIMWFFVMIAGLVFLLWPLVWVTMVYVAQGLLHIWSKAESWLLPPRVGDEWINFKNEECWDVMAVDSQIVIVKCAFRSIRVPRASWGTWAWHMRLIRNKKGTGK